MERRIAGIIYILITFALVNEMSINVQAKDNKRRTKEKGGFQKNICDVSDRESKVHCYCETSREPKNATKAECWVFNGGIPRNDLIWQSFASQPTLKTLSFNVRVDGALSYVPTEALQYLKNLKSINIKYGTIPEIQSYAFANLTNLTEALLSQNEIESLRQYAFAHLPNITLINLDENMIVEIGTDVFYNMPKLHKLTFTKNNISSIKDGAFQHTFNLLELDLNKNNIFHLNRRTFDGLANLRKLDLRRNRIYNLTEFTFAELWNLQELLLGKNDLKYISERAFDGLSQLEKLSLDDNKLAALPSGLFAGVRGLTSLDLRSNELHALTLDDIKPILDNLKPQNSNLQLEDNNFVCDCRLEWMHSLRNETRSQNTKTSLNNVTCKMDPPIVSSAYNKMSDVIENKIDYNQEILHAGITIETLNDKMNVTEKKILKDDLNDENDIDAPSKKAVKRNVLKIPPGTLPCPRDNPKTTEPPQLIIDPVVPIQNEMKTFRLRDSNAANIHCRYKLVLLSCFAFFFT
ncbi:connectin-like [Plodia interpunctella]|uniref:connectin-like n=1 Tax=Plodia interpunctella TaxID=58824 RepID=UPI0023682003|nr:connectin-like [Plodia interpunctella]XP_053608328.1 connectin-like [Plodia interpunctella]XP_053608330.1 connectin-like [Plodia interpunctella]